MTMLSKRTILIALTLSLLAPLAIAQKKNSPQAALDETVRPLFSATGFSNVVVSPDGRQVAWVENSSIYVADTRAGATADRKSVG